MPPSHPIELHACPAAECTQRFPGPITVVASLYHMHMSGAGMVTRHVRNGTELAPFRRRQLWDPNYQGQMFMVDGQKVGLVAQ